MFQDLELNHGGFMGFRGNQKGKIICSGTVGNGYLPCITNILLVDGIMHNLLFIIFNQKSYKVVSQIHSSIIFNGKTKNNIYKIRLSNLKNQNVKCLMSVNEKQWI